MRFLNYVFLCALSSSLFAATVVDDMGYPVELRQSAKRIISLAPDITEIVFAIGQAKHLVGVLSGSDYPSCATKLPQVGSYLGLDLEELLALHPDLIIAWGHAFAKQLSFIRKQGIAVYITNPKQLTDIPRTMLNLGQLTDTFPKAQQAAADFNQALLTLKTKYQQTKPVTVFFQIGHYSLFTINKDSWINQVISLCGGHNVFAQASLTVPKVDWEAILMANPEVVLAATDQRDWKAPWQKWPQITAVKTHALWEIPPDWIERAGPRLIKGVALICERLSQARTISHSGQDKA